MKNQIVIGIILSLVATSSITLASQKNTNRKVLVAVNSSSDVRENAPVASDILNKRKKKKKKPTSQEVEKAAKNLPQTPKIAQTTSPMTNPAVKSLSSPQPMSTRTSLSTVIKSTKPSRWGFKYRSYNAEDLNALENTNGGTGMDHEVRAWDRFNLSYHISDDISVDLMPQLYHTWFGNRDRAQDSTIPGYTQPYAAYLGDTALYLADSKIAKLVGGIIMDGTTSFFFPTSEASQKAGQIGYTRTAIGFSRSFGRVDLKWTESLWYYFQQYQTASVDKGGLPVQNLNYRMWSLLDMSLNITKKLAINLEAGFMNQMQFADDNDQRAAIYQDNIILDPEISYSFNDNFSLAIGIWEQYDMRSQPVVSKDIAGNATTLSQYAPLDYRNGSEGYVMSTLKF